jgi:hypothetical protein
MAKSLTIKEKKQSGTLKIITASETEVPELIKLSTEKLIIYIVGKSNAMGLALSPEDIVIECWLINPAKHSMRKYTQFPDSQVVIKRIGEMKGKKGLLIGSETTGYKLTDISKVIYANIVQQIESKSLKTTKGTKTANREMTSIDETPYNRLKKSAAYEKFKAGKLYEIVESDFLYFYGITWHSKKSFIQNRIKNVDSVVKRFTPSDKILEGVFNYLTENFGYIKEQLINK